MEPRAEITIKENCYKKLELAKKAIYRKDKNRIELSQLNPFDTQALLIVCDSPEAPTPEQLLGMIKSVENKGYSYTVCLFHVNQESLATWYLNNPNVDRNRIKVVADFCKTDEYNQVTAMYDEYSGKQENQERLEKESKDEINEYIERKRKQQIRDANIDLNEEQIERLAIEAKAHYKKEAVYFLYEALEWQKKVKVVVPRITIFFYKNKLNATWSDAVFHSNEILNCNEDKLLLRWVKHEFSDPINKQKMVNNNNLVNNNKSSSHNKPVNHNKLENHQNSSPMSITPPSDATTRSSSSSSSQSSSPPSSVSSSPNSSQPSSPEKLRIVKMPAKPIDLIIDDVINRGMVEDLFRDTSRRGHVNFNELLRKKGLISSGEEMDVEGKKIAVSTINHNGASVFHFESLIQRGNESNDQDFVIKSPLGSSGAKRKHSKSPERGTASNTGLFKRAYMQESAATNQVTHCIDDIIEMIPEEKNNLSSQGDFLNSTKMNNW